MMQEFVDQINKSARSATEDMHTALPGEIKSYDPDKGVATVSVSYTHLTLPTKLEV